MLLNKNKSHQWNNIDCALSIDIGPKTTGFLMVWVYYRMGITEWSCVTSPVFIHLYFCNASGLFNSGI